uniref:THAP4-like heme-binding domain-containing protein n=1 Tax=Sciurus vulgaris TaxID=55149 RepID=A0A8D2JLL4_SCIVU
MNPVVEPLSWMLGTWLSDPLGAGTYPIRQPFQYLEEVSRCLPKVSTSCKFNSFHPDTHRPLHRQCGFICLKPNTNKVAFVAPPLTGVVEVQEGEVNGQELCIVSHSITRISFTKEPHVEQVSLALPKIAVVCAQWPVGPLQVPVSPLLSPSPGPPGSSLADGQVVARLLPSHEHPGACVTGWLTPVCAAATPVPGLTLVL